MGDDERKDMLRARGRSDRERWVDEWEQRREIRQKEKEEKTNSTRKAVPKRGRVGGTRKEGAKAMELLMRSPSLLSSLTTDASIAQCPTPAIEARRV